jgi:Phage integrase, N-terminal SAM-like domain/Phage integrase family
MDAEAKPNAAGCTVAPAGSPRLLDRLRGAVRVRHYSFRTEECYAAWVRRFILFHNKRHPLEMGAAKINAFLTDLAVRGHVSASTQNQAFSAILFLYQKVLEVDPGRIAGVVRANRPKRLPVVLSVDEVRRVLAGMEGTYRLIAALLYGSGLRLNECLSLRVQDVDLERRELLVRHGKGGKDRRTMVPDTLVGDLRRQLERVETMHRRERERGRGQVRLAGRDGPQGANGDDCVGVAMAVPIGADFARPAKRLRGPPSRPRGTGNPGHPRSVVEGRAEQARDEPLVPALFRNPPAGGRPGYSHGAGIAWSRRCEYNDDLYARVEPGRPRSA